MPSQSINRRKQSLSKMFTEVQNFQPGMFKNELKIEADKVQVSCAVSNGFPEEILSSEMTYTTQDLFPAKKSIIIAAARGFFKKPENADKTEYIYNYEVEVFPDLIRLFAVIHDRMVWLITSHYEYKIRLLNRETGEAEFCYRNYHTMEESEVLVPENEEALQSEPFVTEEKQFQITPNIWDKTATF